MTCMKRKILLISLVLSVFLIILQAPLFTASAQEQGEPKRIAESSEVSVKPSFQTENFVFLVKKENGEFEAAGANNIKDPVVMQGMAAAAKHLGENPEFRAMLDFYKKSHEKRFDAKKKELNDKIKETEEMLAKRKISKSDARFDLNYYNNELKKISESKAPPLAIVVGRKPEEKTSYMMASPIEFSAPSSSAAKSGLKTIESPGYIMLQYDEFVSMANENTKLEGLSVLAHETGHVISNNTTYLRNINLDYKDRNPLFLVDENLRTDTQVVEFMKKGDPMPDSHWRAKVISSQAAFEEEFAEFTASFFLSPNHDGDNIADKDFQANKIGYRLSKGTNEVSATLEWSDTVKNTGELMDTEFFIAKLLHRIAMSYDNPYDGYQNIVNIKSSDEFRKSPNLNSFIKIFAANYPQDFERFKVKFTEEISAVNAESTRRIQTDERRKIAELLGNTSSLIISIGQSEIKDIPAAEPGAATSETAVKYTRTVKGKPGASSSDNVKIKIMSEKIKSGNIDSGE